VRPRAKENVERIKETCVNKRERKKKENKHNKRIFHDSHVCDDAYCSLAQDRNKTSSIQKKTTYVFKDHNEIESRIT
jgi:hypothetical protein